MINQNIYKHENCFLNIFWILLVAARTFITIIDIWLKKFVIIIMFNHFSNCVFQIPVVFSNSSSTSGVCVDVLFPTFLSPYIFGTFRKFADSGLLTLGPFKDICNMRLVGHFLWCVAVLFWSFLQRMHHRQAKHLLRILCSLFLLIRSPSRTRSLLYTD